LPAESEAAVEIQNEDGQIILKVAKNKLNKIRN